MRCVVDPFQKPRLSDSSVDRSDLTLGFAVEIANSYRQGEPGHYEPIRNYMSNDTGLTSFECFKGLNAGAFVTVSV